MKFTCLNRDFRALIAYRLDKETYLSLLGEDCGGDMKVLARYEYHATHPGWHFHANCGAEAPIVGRTGGLTHRLPRGRQTHRRASFGITGDTSAESKAISAFGLDHVEGGLFS